MPILSPDTLEFISRSPEQTRRLGARLGTLLEGGEVLALEGDLGAGKTVFAQGIGEGWGATAPLISPTFVLIRQHRRPQNDVLLYHIDLYRLTSPDEIAGLGLDEMLGDPGAICLVEWPNRAPEIFAGAHMWITLQWVDEFRRTLTIRAEGDEHRQLLDTFRKEILGR